MDENNIIIESAERTRAVKLDMEIKFHAEMAQRSLYEVCRGLKEMRDDKLYKELGYQNFEEYCENEIGFTRQQAYSYISVAKSLPEDFVKSTLQIGVQKLSLLARLDEADRQEVVQNVDVDSVTVKQLKAEIEELKASKALLEETNAGNMQVLNNYQQRNRELQEEARDLQAKYDEAEGYKNAYFEENIQLGDEIQELNAKLKALNDQLIELENQEPEVQDAVWQDINPEIERLTREKEELERQLQNANAEHLKELSRVRTEARQNVKSVPDYTEAMLTLVKTTCQTLGDLKKFMEEHPGLSKYSANYFKTVIDRLEDIQVEMMTKKG